jgi:hypothetical protein
VARGRLRAGPRSSLALRQRAPNELPVPTYR